MKSKTFLTYERPLLTCMVQADNPDRIKELIDLSRPEGAEAFGMQLCRLKPEFRRPEIYRELFNRPDGLPTYVTNYRFFENSGKSDDVLAQELHVMDSTAASLCMDNKIDILVFNLNNPHNIVDAVCGKTIGTLVK